MITVDDFVTRIMKILEGFTEQDVEKILHARVTTIEKKDFGPELNYIKYFIMNDGIMIVNSTCIEFVGDSYDC